MNRRKLVRALLTIATLSVVWFVVSPASAMGLLSAVGTDSPNQQRAPVCDPRGAIGFAPPPQIQDEERSLDIPADCVEMNPLESKNVVPGHHAHGFDFSSSQEPAFGMALALPPVVFAERLAARVTVEARPPPGVRTDLERPPRG